MLTISYNVSSKLKDNLYKIENLRRKILLTPISPKEKLKLRWQAKFNRIYSSLKLSGNKLTRNDMGRLLSKSKGKKMSQEETDVINYKNAIDHIIQNWLGSNNSINSQSVIALYKIIGKGKLSTSHEELQYLLDYLQAKQENPIIQAAVVYIELMKMQPFTERNDAISLLTSLLFLYKYGYDFRGFLAYETLWAEDNNYFNDNLKSALSATSLTLWLEYFSECILRYLESIGQYILKPSNIPTDASYSFFEVNDRQRSILAFLDKPDVTITNRHVQKWHKVSQITASRDLAKLTNLGFLFSHGKGRSVYYTKI